MCFYHDEANGGGPGVYDMGAQLNIKSDDAYRMASRLSELTGESLTMAVTKALRDDWTVSSGCATKRH